MTKASPRKIIAEFPDIQTADYVRTVLRRKGENLPDYVLNNLEWDIPLPCMDDIYNGKKPDSKVCLDCDRADTCPDARRGVKS